VHEKRWTCALGERVNKILSGASALAIAFGLFTITFAQTVVSDRTVARKAAAYMTSVVAADGFSGSVIVARNGKALFSQAYGLASVELRVPNTPQTLFRIASLTKSVTAAAIMLLQERGQLKVTDSVCAYVADCPPAWQPMTHTSGLPIPYSPTDGRPMGSVGVTPAEILDGLRSKPLEFVPNEKFEYTNSGYLLLGMIIERVSTKPYGDFLQQNIFEPLGMTHTGNFSNRSIVPNRASGYALPDGGGLVNSPQSDPSRSFAAGSLWSTTEDLLRFDTALHAAQIVSRTSLKEMLTPYMEEYGYGLAMSTNLNRSVIGHAGTVSGFTCDLVHYSAEHVTVIILSNKPRAGDLTTIGDHLAAIAFGEDRLGSFRPLRP
jgi:CubicO group peptidase (beta-lactamase class C family)